MRGLCHVHGFPLQSAVEGLDVGLGLVDEQFIVGFIESVFQPVILAFQEVQLVFGRVQFVSDHVEAGVFVAHGGLEGLNLLRESGDTGGLGEVKGVLAGLNLLVLDVEFFLLQLLPLGFLQRG